MRSCLFEGDGVDGELKVAEICQSNRARSLGAPPPRRRAVLTFKYLHSDLFISCANCENGIGAGIRHAAQLVLPMPPHGRRARRPDDACRRAATVRHRNPLRPGQFAEGPRANGPLPTRSRPALLFFLGATEHRAQHLFQRRSSTETMGASSSWSSPVCLFPASLCSECA